MLFCIYIVYIRLLYNIYICIIFFIHWQQQSSKNYYYFQYILRVCKEGMKNNNMVFNAGQGQGEIVMEPPLYFAEEHIWSLCFHPTADLIACSEITGQIQILSYTSDDVKPMLQNQDLHKSSARWCQFNHSGNLLASCGQDKRIGFIDGTGKIAHIIKKAHSQPINRCKFINDQMLISGDDDGHVKVWDLRTVAPVFQLEEQGQNQAITGFAFQQTHAQYLVYISCINGTVASYDLRRTSDSLAKLTCLSDSVDEQLNGIQIIKNGTYLACPSSQGIINIFKCQKMQQITDRIQGQPGSVEAILKLDQNTIITGCEDGFVRGVGIYPNKILQVLGQHEQQQNFPIQSISLSHCHRFLASSSHDNSIKFYDVNQFVKKRAKNIVVTFQQAEQGQAVKEKIEEQMENDADSDDFQEDSGQQQSDSQDQMQEEKTKKKKKKNKKVSLKARQKQIKKQNTKSFFQGL